MNLQRNRYRGDPERSWIRVRLIARDGRSRSLDLLADTGCPYAIILGRSVFERFAVGSGEDVRTNFGRLEGGWVTVAIPKTGFRQQVSAFASERVATSTAVSFRAFRGLAGLPLLRMMEYGGDDESFWVRSR